MVDKYYYNSDRTMVLSVDAEGKEAHLLIEEGIPFHSENEILKLLKKAGIVEGFDEAKSYLARNKIEKRPGKRFLIARGSPVLLPKANYCFLIQGRLMDQELLSSEELTIDDLIERTSVTRKTPLATFHALDSGREGFDVFGKPISLPKNKIDLCHHYSGENVIYDEENGQYVAEADGYPYIDQSGKLAIWTDIDLNGDVVISKSGLGYSKRPSVSLENDIDIFGNLVINGNLAGPGRLNLKGDLTVSGDISKCNLYIEGQTKCEGKISDSSIISLNTIEADSTANSQICSGNELKIENSAKFSLLVAEGDVLLDDKFSYCWSCQIYAGKNIRLTEINHSQEKQSKLVISIAPFTKVLISFLTKRIDASKKDPFVDKENLEQLQSELAELQQYLIRRFSVIETEESKITILKRIAAGTYVRVMQYSRELDRNMEEVSFYTDRKKLVSKTQQSVS